VNRAFPEPLGSDPSEGSGGHILPVSVGDEAAAVALADQLRVAGVWVPAIRYPTVARGSARLRLTFSATHTAADFDCLEEAFNQACIQTPPNLSGDAA